MKIIVAIYARLSREDENKSYVDIESRSIENQIKILSEYAKNNGFDVYRVYYDDGYSGATFDRPQFQELLKDMKKQKFNTVLVKDISRLGRSLHKVGELIEKTFPENNIRLISVSDRYDSSKNSNDDSIVLRNFLNDYYLKDFRKKCKNARLHYAQTKHLNYYPKFGYNFDKDGNEIIDEYSADIVRKIFDLVGNKKLSTCKVAEILNNENIPTRSYYATQILGLKPLQKKPATKWNAEKVWEIAKDYEYCGHSLNWIRHKEEEKIILKNTHLAIIDEELYQKTQEIINHRSKQRLDHIGKLIIDRESERNLLYSKNKGDIQEYYLRDLNTNRRIYSIKAKPLEDVIYQDVINTIKCCQKDKDKMYNIYKAKLFSGKEFNPTKIKNKLQQLNTEYSKLLESYFNKTITEEKFNDCSGQMLLKIKEQEVMLNSEMDIKSKLSLFDIRFEKFIENLKVLPVDKFQLIRLAVKKIYINTIPTKTNIDITIVYKFEE